MKAKRLFFSLCVALTFLFLPASSFAGRGGAGGGHGHDSAAESAKHTKRLSEVTVRRTHNGGGGFHDRRFHGGFRGGFPGGGFWWGGGWWGGGWGYPYWWGLGYPYPYPYRGYGGGNYGGGYSGGFYTGGYGGNGYSAGGYRASSYGK
jgi:hypothetical protein